jgi:hypothetical protein
MKRIAATALLAMGLLQVAAAQDSPGKSDEQADSSAAAQAAGEQARATAARELQATANEFKVVTIEPAQWSDSSLGCRKPNAMYTQVVTSGYVVVLEREGKRHQVNVAGSRAVMCDVATRISGTVRQPLPARGLDRVAGLARQDLANRLHVNVEQIRIASMEPRRWTDDDMNCRSGKGEPGDGSPGARGGLAVRHRLSTRAGRVRAHVLLSHGPALSTRVSSHRRPIKAAGKSHAF